MCGFEYEVIDGEVTITTIKDLSCGDITIPEFIYGYPVTNIRFDSLIQVSQLCSINGVNITYIGLNMINNKFIYNRFIYKINHQIGDDYTSYYNYSDNYRYFIGDYKYDNNFRVIY